VTKTNDCFRSELYVKAISEFQVSLIKQKSPDLRFLTVLFRPNLVESSLN